MSNCKSKRELIHAKCNGHCAYCGKALKLENEMTVDHLIPQSKGGTEDFDNLLPSCVECNRSKADLELEFYRQKVFWPKLTTGTLSSFKSAFQAFKSHMFFFEK